MPITVLLVDDHPVMRTELRGLLKHGDDVLVVGEAASGEEAIVLARHLAPDVVLCDLCLGTGIDGIQTAAALRAHPQGPAVIVLTTFADDEKILRAIDAGACGYLLKDVSPTTIISSIKEAATGGTISASEVPHKVSEETGPRWSLLTERELEILRLLDTEASHREIADELFISEATVKVHLVHILSKLCVENLADALSRARDTGMLR